MYMLTPAEARATTLRNRDRAQRQMDAATAHQNLQTEPRRVWLFAAMIIMHANRIDKLNRRLEVGV